MSWDGRRVTLRTVREHCVIPETDKDDPRSGNELLVAFKSGGSMYTRLFTFSGQPLANAVPVLFPAKPSILAPAPGGFALLY